MSRGVSLLMRQAMPAGPDELSQLRTRALVNWLTIGVPAQGQRADLDPVATFLHEHAGHLYVVVVAAGGKVLARYRVVGRSQHWRLRREPHDGDLLALVSAGPMARGRLAVLARSADLRHQSVILASRSAVLRSRSAAALAQAEAAVPRPRRSS